jgi:uncharacterized protein (TIGR03435 family)
MKPEMHMTKPASLGVLGIMLLLLPALAQQPKFDLADVHVSATPRWFAQNNGGLVRDGRYINRDATMLNLIEAAWSVSEDTVAGGPSWLDTDLYDVIAKIPDGTTPATARLMLQALLAERFGLVVRNDTRPMPRYVLSVAKGGSKLKPAAASGNSGDSGCRQQMVPPARGGSGPSLPNMKAICHNLTSRQIAENLHQLGGGPINTYLPREVFDSTKLDGAWDFELEFTPIGMLDLKGSDGITLFDAVSKQLGLTLELKDVPVPALVVESVKRNPTPNPPGISTDLGLAAARFEVASIKPVNPDLRFGPNAPPPPPPNAVGNRGGSELRFGGTLRTLIGQAFRIQPNAVNDEIIGLPKSADSQVWDITAKLPSVGEGAPIGSGPRPQPPPRSIVLEMLRGLLVDQFELKTHRENREVTVYVMTLMPGKLKMTQTAETERMACKAAPNAPKPFPNMGTMVDCRNITMAEFAENLEQATGFFDHPIVDGTGLKGGWSFLIGWSRPEPVLSRALNPSQAGGAIGDAADPSGTLCSYDALEREIGIKMVKQKRSIPVVVVDHVDEKPIE